MSPDALEWLTEQVLEALGRAEPVPPAALALLVRRYAATGDGRLHDGLGPALARALEVSEHADRTPEAADWLMLVVEAALVADDDRLREAAAVLASSLQAEWPSRGSVGVAMRSVDASLGAAHLIESDGYAIISAAVDELERIVGVAYEPGDGLTARLDDHAQPGTLADHVAASSALLTAHLVTGRLPYAMLGEELVQFARRRWWDEPTGRWSGANFLESCAAARVLCRLAALLDDPDYRRHSVVAAGADYAGDAERILASLAAEYRTHGVHAAVYGLALDEWFALGRHPVYNLPSSRRSIGS